LKSASTASPTTKPSTCITAPLASSTAFPPCLLALSETSLLPACTATWRTPSSAPDFLEQENLAEQLKSSDFGVSTGLIHQEHWEMSKWYFVNVERGNIADKLQPRNINISFMFKDSNVAIDLLIFIFHSDQMVKDVELFFLEHLAL
jgi:hypothetical protein